MMKSIKRLVLAGAAVMVMMSFALPAMADDLSSLSTDYGSDFLGNYGSYLTPVEEPIVVGPAPSDTSSSDYCWRTYYRDENGVFVRVSHYIC
jgi:hypothetical protein